MQSLRDYEGELKRLAWRLQYQEKRRARRERGYYEEMNLPSYRMEDEALTRLQCGELVASLSSSSGRQVITGLYFRDRTESQLAREMNVSQQAVNKWKHNMLRQLSRKINSGS
ncbi:hypothetical protein [Paenibacillus daejeonensis]|uniref:hypothetical protein n=1 Tax=Paenibacillus daejeonensis TaxID=135193 RepID=UPI0003A183A3|nr:hypothetical protein [Paenibacillus daejeonensis]